MKKIFIVLIVSIALIFCSCDDVYDEIIITNVESYDSIWELPERRVVEKSVLFPESVDKQNLLNFKCKHTTYQWLGTGWQIELSLKYDENTFEVEKARLNSVCTDSVVCGNSEYFSLPTYATVWNWNCCFEYAVVNEVEQTIGYIYLQLINEDDLEISSLYKPSNYSMEIEGEQEFSVYGV